MESRLRRTLKKENLLPRGRGESRMEERARKEDFLKNQGVLDDSGESAKGTDPVNYPINFPLFLGNRAIERGAHWNERLFSCLVIRHTFCRMDTNIGSSRLRKDHNCQLRQRRRPSHRAPTPWCADIRRGEPKSQRASRWRAQKSWSPHFPVPKRFSSSHTSTTEFSKVFCRGFPR